MRSDDKKACVSYLAAGLTAAAAWFLLPELLAGQELTLIEYYCANALQQVFLFIVPALLILWGRKPRWAEFLTRIKPLSTDVTGYIMLGVVACTVVASLVVSFWLPLVNVALGYVPESLPMPEPAGAMQWLAAIFCLGVIPGIAEELFFRSVFQTALVKRFAGAGVWITAVIFALLHLDVASFPGLVFIGVLLGKIYVRRGLVASALFHGLYNLIVLWLNTAGADIGFVEIFLCLIAYRFAVRRLLKEDEDHAVDGAGM